MGKKGKFMCNYSEYVWEKGMVKGREEGLEEGMVKGREEGLVMGREKGREEGETRLATLLLRVNYSATSSQASCFTHHCAGCNELQRLVLHSVHRR